MVDQVGSSITRVLFEIIDLKGCENQVANHLLRLEEEGRPKESMEINDEFLYERILAASHDLMRWFGYDANFLESNIMPEGLNSHHRKKFLYEAKKFYWDEPYQLKICTDGVRRQFVPEIEMIPILEVCHSSPVEGLMEDTDNC